MGVRGQPQDRQGLGLTIPPSLLLRRAFIVGGVATFATPIAAGAQQVGKVYRVAILATVAVEQITGPTPILSVPSEREARFREQMQAEGQNGKLLDRKFQEGLKKAKDSPDPPKRPFDYD